MNWLHPLTFVFILIIVFCVGSWCGFAFGYQTGVRRVCARFSEMAPEIVDEVFAALGLKP
jgi:hypothetical protein